MSHELDTVVSDESLLRQYIAHGDREAFAELVRRHIGFVRTAARRQTRGDSHLADDVTQAVFIVLARRARTIRPGVLMAAWLFSVTRHAAGNIMKSRDRQTLHLQRFADDARDADTSNSDALEQDEHRAAIRRHLDESLAKLPSLDRSGVLLHYFGGQTHAQVGATLGLSAQAARKRISRAVDRLRDFLAGRGVVAGSVALAAALREEALASATAISPALVASTSNVATIAAGSAAASSTPLFIADSVARMFALAKLKTAAAAVLALAGLVGVTATAASFSMRGEAPKPAEPAKIAAMTFVNTAMQPAPEASKYSARINENLLVEFLGVSKLPADEGSWFSIAGEPCEPVDVATMRGGMAPDPTHVLSLRITRPEDAEVRLNMEGVHMLRIGMADAGDNVVLMTAHFSPEAGAAATSLDVKINLSTEPWTTIHTHERLEETTSFDAGEERGEVTLAELTEEDGNASAEIRFAGMPGEPLRIAAVDDKGKEHIPSGIKAMNNNGELTNVFTFDIPMKKVKKLIAQTRKYTHSVDVTGISLTPENPTEPKIVAK